MKNQNPHRTQILSRSCSLFLLPIILLSLFAFSCGRKSDVERPKDYQRPNFEGFSDEMQSEVKTQNEVKKSEQKPRR